MLNGETSNSGGVSQIDYKAIKYNIANEYHIILLLGECSGILLSRGGVN